MSGFEHFQGTAKRLEDFDISRMGHRIGVGEDEIHAFMEVEAAGSGFDSRGRPKMLFEPHIFYRRVPRRLRDQAVEAGLAYRNWGEQRYPTDSYSRLDQAITFLEEHGEPITSALMSASWGLGQIMGFNYAAAGYDSPEAMAQSFMEDEDDHLEAMVNFIIHEGIDDDIRAHRWEAVARVYNGPGYAKHGYHTRLARAYRKWAKTPDTEWSPEMDPEYVEVETPLAKFGDKGAMVRTVQTLLTGLGYALGKVDGDFGPATRASLLAFQADAGLPTDAMVTQAVLDALEAGRERPVSTARSQATVSDLRREGSSTVREADIQQAGAAGVTILGGIAGAKEVLSEVEGASETVSGITATLEPFTKFLADNWWVALLVVGGIVVWRTGAIKLSRVKDHRSGKNLGR